MARRRHGGAGFALFELMLALAVVALVATLALPFAAPSSTSALRAKAREIAALLRADRNAALREGRSTLTRIDLPARAILSGTGLGMVAVPERFMLDVTDGLSQGARFEPDSRASEGEIRLAAASGPAFVISLRIHGGTGAIDIRERRPGDGR